MTDPGKILALDVGTKRTGVAVSDEQQKFAFPLTQFESKNLQQLIQQVRAIAAEETAEIILLGMPLDQYGEVGTSAKKMRKIGTMLQEQLKKPVIEWDERYTTAQAERSLIEADLSRKKRKKVLDKIAATILLQSYLDNIQSQQDTVTTWKDNFQDNLQDSLQD